MNRSEGFTLLEILITVALLGLLFGLLMPTYTQVLDAHKRTLDDSPRDSTATIALDRMERELVGTILLVRPEDVPPEEHPWIFATRDEVIDGEDADAIRFVTESPARVAGAAIAGGFRIVTYAARTDSEGRLNLYRAEEVLPKERVLDLPALEEPPAVRDIKRFNITVTDDKSRRTADVWDSTELQEDRLPSAVQLQIQLNDRNRDGVVSEGRLFTRGVELRVRPIGEEEEDSDCAGPSVDECLERFAEVLASLGPEVEQIVDQAKDGVPGGSCFADVVEQPEGQTLFEQLEQLTQLDPMEICQ